MDQVRQKNTLDRNRMQLFGCEWSRTAPSRDRRWSKPRIRIQEHFVDVFVDGQILQAQKDSTRFHKSVLCATPAARNRASTLESKARATSVRSTSYYLEQPSDQEPRSGGAKSNCCHLDAALTPVPGERSGGIHSHRE